MIIGLSDFTPTTKHWCNTPVSYTHLKEYSRIIKFKNAVDLLRSTSSNQLFSVAIEAGYYDTAHLSKEIKALSGNTPGSFLSLPAVSYTHLDVYKRQNGD